MTCFSFESDSVVHVDLDLDYLKVGKKLSVDMLESLDVLVSNYEMQSNQFD